ncbi:GTPase activating protein 1-like [Zingiber officinale]|uniref:C2 domain-containing protein n=1 Tax=Zingiber officinale TaxID=94328 RepID=A0A8J5LX16_ZINOF|nr:GTPase activating protein 1-like [Zingiber officinale]KAG6538818.1 hypothetical protein ZIOFF_003948 [Zingiber officinale]
MVTAAESLLGLLCVRVKRGTNLAVRDVLFGSSDPYVVLSVSPKQKVKTRVIKHNTNPVWNEDLTLSIKDPSVPVRLEVYDKDTFTVDDPMGEAEVDIAPFVEVVKMSLKNVPNGRVIATVEPRRNNCLAEQSRIYFTNGKVRQDVVVRLRNVERGEIELQLQWVSIPGYRR